ncbi:MAG: D-alanyl-D-alanine carboxypeptidase family protein [Arenimonas sp.]|nr:D-alanyl-D-alanine carboxypeptidase family protein [Arenimonas sp.]
MRALNWHLVNSESVEAWPSHLLRARANAAARELALAPWALRRKSDGRFLAAVHRGRVHALVPQLHREPGVDAALAALDRDAAGLDFDLPMDGLHERLAALGLDTAYAEQTGLAEMAEPSRLEFAGFDRYRRPLWLLAPAARAWRRMQSAALGNGVRLQAISGYRSHAYQLGIFERKLARGLSLDEVLAVNAAPGYSEHHGGCALDIGAPGEPAAEESFESSPAYGWLGAHAGGFGFSLSYPRGNLHGIVFEPWHWRWRAAQD